MRKLLVVSLFREPTVSQQKNTLMQHPQLSSSAYAFALTVEKLTIIEKERTVTRQSKVYQLLAKEALELLKECANEPPVRHLCILSNVGRTLMENHLHEQGVEGTLEFETARSAFLKFWNDFRLSGPSQR